MRKLTLGLLLLVVLVISCGKLKEPTDPGAGSGTGTGGGTDTGSGGPPPPPPPDPNATFTRIQTQIFTPTCAVLGCHDRIARQSDLILIAGQSYGNIVGVTSVEMNNLKRVNPNDPENSYLYRKIIGVGITGDRMPQAGISLTADEISLIRDWIRRGAPND